MTKFIADLLLFTVLRYLVPVSVRGWAYDVRYNAWAHCPVWGDLAQAQRSPGFDINQFKASRAASRAAEIANFTY